MMSTTAAASKDHIFPMGTGGQQQQQQQQHHFNDYGFDPQIDYLQTIWWKARKSTTTTSSSILQSCRPKEPKPLDSLRFKLQKPISKEGKSKKRGPKWWKGILQFWKWRRGSNSKDDPHHHHHHPRVQLERSNGAPSSRHGFGPVYLAESSISRGPCRRKAVVSGGRPITGMAKMVDVPYLNLRELNAMDVESPISGSYASSPLPIYLVT